VTASLHNNLVIAGVLFAAGFVGFLTRRNLIIMFLSAELMLQGVALNLLAFSRHYQNYQGQSFAIFVLTVAACEAAIALALILVMYRTQRTLDVDVWRSLAEAPAEPVAEEPIAVEPAVQTFPHLPPAGREPVFVGAPEERHG
jgi:NADH-quinone oxidoreductase subunit K